MRVWSILFIALCGLVLLQPLSVRAQTFDPVTGNAPLEIVIPAVDPVFFDEVTITGGDPSILLRYTTLIVNSWFDAVAPYHPTARAVYSSQDRRVPFSPSDNTNLNIAIVAASRAVLDDLFPHHADRWAEMVQTVLATVPETHDTSDALHVGAMAGQSVFDARLHDGMNQDGTAGGYDAFPRPFGDTTGYAPVNDAFTLRDPSRWQPALIIDRPGIFRSQFFVTPQLGQVTPYTDLWGLNPPLAPPVASDVNNIELYRGQADAVIAATAAITEEQRMLAEFFENKLFSLPVSMVVAAMKDRVNLMDFVHVFFAQEVAVFDAGIWVWHHKRDFDAVRPFSAIAYLYGQEQIPTWAQTGTTRADRWQSYLPVADHPEYPSATSCLCAAHAAAVEDMLGDPELGWEVTFEAGSSFITPGEIPSQDITHVFETWDDFRLTCGETRLWSGVHFEASVRNVQNSCMAIGRFAKTYVTGLISGE